MLHEKDLSDELEEVDVTKEEVEGLVAIRIVLEIEPTTFEEIMDAVGVTKTLEIAQRCIHLKKVLDFYEKHHLNQG